MTEFSPEKFEEKYTHYFPELQTAYKNAFSTMNEAYDSQLIHAIDQQVLNESEPFYEAGDEGERGSFRVELPEKPVERVTAVVAEDQKIDRILDEYVERIEAELARVFGVDRDSQKA